MTYDETVKKKVLVRLAKNINVKDISLELNVSKTTIYKWKKMYEMEIYFIKISLEVRSLMNQGKYNEALGKCSKEEFLNDAPLQSQRVALLIVQKRYKEALEICNRKEFFNNEILQKQKANILMLQDNYPLLLNKIKQREIIFDEIKTCEICPLEKIILTVALYESKKYPQKIILKYLKTCFLEYENDNESLNILNLLKERVMQKNYIFDIEFYQHLIIKNKRIEERHQLLLVKENLNEHKSEEVNNSLK